MLRPHLTCECGNRMWLPSPTSAADFLKEPWTPKESLSREVACSACGRASAYTVRDVRWGMGEDPSIGQELFSCWCIETVCAEPRCELPDARYRMQEGKRSRRIGAMTLTTKSRHDLEMIISFHRLMLRPATGTAQRAGSYPEQARGRVAEMQKTQKGESRWASACENARNSLVGECCCG